MKAFVLGLRSSSTPGRLPNTYGKETLSEKFVGGTVFIDEASELIFVKNQVRLGATETKMLNMHLSVMPCDRVYLSLATKLTREYITPKLGWLISQGKSRP